jgi:hypothetical protein
VIACSENKCFRNTAWERTHRRRVEALQGLVSPVLLKPIQHSDNVSRLYLTPRHFLASPCCGPANVFEAEALNKRETSRAKKR